MKTILNIILLWQTTLQFHNAYHICYKCEFGFINLQIQLYGMFMGILETYIKTHLEILKIDILCFLI